MHIPTSTSLLLLFCAAVPNSFQWHTQATVEHILPQNPNEDWLKTSTGWDFEASVHKLGNQCLLTGADNTALGNLGWKDKKEMLMKNLGNGDDITSSRTAETLRKLEKWDRQAFEGRHADLRGRLLRRWTLAPARRVQTGKQAL
jgi:hypothetical protein